MKLKEHAYLIFRARRDSDGDPDFSIVVWDYYANFGFCDGGMWFVGARRKNGNPAEHCQTFFIAPKEWLARVRAFMRWVLDLIGEDYRRFGR